jgi:hypothetical protein
MPDTQIHIDEIAEKGWTIIPDAIADDLVGELADDLGPPEHELAMLPADNTFEGRRTKRAVHRIDRAIAPVVVVLLSGHILTLPIRIIRSATTLGPERGAREAAQTDGHRSSYG